MGPVLVIGASGQLGTAATKRLLQGGAEVRALVRSEEHAARFRSLGAEPVLGDLTDSASVERACEGAAAVVATANAAVPSRPSDSFEAVERDGYRNLIRAAVQAGVGRFVYTSVFVTEHSQLSTLVRYKVETEQFLAASGLPCTIFRAGIFMDVAFAMMGSDLPLRGAETATALRPYRFTSRHFSGIRNNIEEKRLAMIPGGSRRHSFICVEDVASFLAAAARGGPCGTYDLGGPEALTYADVVRIYENILGHTLRVRQTPAAVFRVAAAVLRPFSPAAANLMVLNYLSATADTVIDSRPACAAFDVELTSAEAFLRSKAALAQAV